ncbi:MAG: LytTR family DNA-binding domain-containing protein [Bacteroidota bacterium]
MLSAIIIEDEQQNLSALKYSLSLTCPDVNLIGECGSIAEAKALFKNNIPDIVFLDINLSDGNAFDLIDILEKDLKKEDFDTLKIIFTTASNKYAIRAFRISAVDYLLKPIIPSELKQAVDKVKILNSKKNYNYDYRLLLDNISNQTEEKKIHLSTLTETKKCSISEIIRCESEHNYTTFYFTKDKPLMVSKTLKEFEEILRDYGFERVHRSHLINLKFAKSYLKKDNGTILMIDGTEIPISRRKKEIVFNLFK